MKIYQKNKDNTTGIKGSKTEDIGWDENGNKEKNLNANSI